MPPKPCRKSSQIFKSLAPIATFFLLVTSFLQTAVPVVAAGPYTINATATTGGTIEPTGDVSVPEGSNQSFTITPSPGYHVADVLVDGASKGPITYYPFTEVTSDHTIAASFAATSHTVTFDSNGGSGTMAPQTANVATALTTNAFTEAGYSFSGWNTLANGTGTSYGDGASYAFSADVTLYAQWTVKQYTITFDSAGGSAVSSITQAFGTAVTAPANPTRAGYTFASWNPAVPATMPASNTTCVAQWTPLPSHTVTFDSNGGSGTMAPQTANVATALTTNAFTEAGYSFSGWNTLANGTGTSYGDGASYAFSADVTLYAQWTVKQYTITFDSAGGSAVSSITQAFGTAVTAPANPTRAGYTFASWNPAVPATMPASNTTCVAQWTPLPSHTVTFDSNGGSGTMAPQTANVATALTTNAFTEAGYSFSGWNTLANGTGTSYGDGASYAFSADVTLYAQWTVKQYTITFDSAGGSAVSSITQAFGTAVTAPANPTRAGYTFASWNPAVPATMPASNTTCVAQWTPLPSHTVTFDSNGGSGTMAPQTANVATALTTNAFTEAGYSFSGWNTLANGTGTSYGDGASYAFSADVTLYAQWTVKQYTITFDSAGGSAVSSITQAFGTAVTAPANPTRAGYTFASWNPAVPATMPASNTTCVAQWTPLPSHTVTFDSNGGSGTMAPQTANVATALTTNAFTEAGYSFSGWNTLANGTGTSYGDGASYAFSADVTLYAQWTVKQYTITFDSAGGSAVSSITQAFGTAVTAPANPTRAGYTFASWNPAVPATMPASNTTCVAQWTPLPSHTVTFDSNGGSGTMAPQTANVATALTTNAFTEAGYSFSGWNTLANGTGTSYGDGASYAFSADVTLYAQWTVKQYTITFDSAGGSAVSSITQAFGTAVTAPANPTRAGYTFASWNPAVPATMPASNTTCVAQWTPLPSHTVTFDSNGGSGTMAPQTANVATALTTNAFTEAGYSFSGWNTLANGTGTSYGDGASYAFSADVTLYAQWTVKQYTITFDSAGGSAVSSITQAFGTAVTAPANPTRAGYTFASWNPAVPATMPASNTTCVAQWTPLPSHTVTFDSNGGSGTMAPQTANVATALTTNAFTEAGYSFSGWNTLANGTGTSYGDGASYAFSADVTLYAQWTVKQYTITFDSAGGSAVSSITQAFGTAVTAPANPTRAGYTFASWNPAVPATMPASNTTCVAQWTPLPSHTVTFDSNGGSGTMAPQTANVATALTTNAFTEAGYSFSGWNTLANGTGTSYGDGASYAFSADVTLYAQWTVNNYIVTFNSQGGSTIDPVVVSRGGLVTIPTAPTKVGYTFSGWYKEAACTNAWNFVSDTVTVATTLYSKWTEIPSGGGGGGGGGGFGNQLIGINLSGTSPWMDGNGRSITAGQIHTPDNRLSINVPTGVAIWNGAGAAQPYISATLLASPSQPPPQTTLIIAWEMGPNGVTFTPAITMTFTYFDSDIPVGTRETDLYIAWWDGTAWVKLIGTVDSAANTVTVQVTHFTSFALLAPAAPPVPTPTVKINTPATGSSFDTGSVSLSISITNLTTVTVDKPNVPGQGRIVYYLDVPIPTTNGVSALTSTGTFTETDATSNTWVNLKPGVHSLGVQLVQNDNSPFNPPVFASISITIKDAAVIVPPTTTATPPTQAALPTEASNPTTPKWAIPSFFLAAALVLGTVLYWRSRRPIKLKYTNR